VLAAGGAPGPRPKQEGAEHQPRRPLIARSRRGRELPLHMEKQKRAPRVAALEHQQLDLMSGSGLTVVAGMLTKGLAEGEAC
jgi:hypothetical protein